MLHFSLESCITSLSEGIAAFQKGAHRLEVCSKLETEGMTPELNWVRDLCNQINIPVRVMIRETELGFEADNHHMHRMMGSIEAFKSISIDGFVIGILKNGRIDREAMQSLFKVASPLPITFHKAMDQSEDVMGDLEWLNDFSIIDTILTSGGKAYATDGVGQILEMKKNFKGHIMAGGKITQQNLNALHEVLQLQWYHGRNIL